MAIEHLYLQGVRNLAPTTITPSPQINQIHGLNGSGKTSLLEAIYYLAYARSFRTHKHQNLIQSEQDLFTLFCKLGSSHEGGSHQLGIERNRSGERRIKLNGEWLKSAAELAGMLPVQLLDPGMFTLLEGSPQYRREYLDWGVFHVEQQFLNTWRDFKLAHKTRNALLKREQVSELETTIWHDKLASLAEAITIMRIEYIQALKPYFDHYMALLSPDIEVSLTFNQGWVKGRPYREVLDESWDTDRKQGFTQVGPQRADLRLRSGNALAVEKLSRGQQKMVVCALKLAQAKMYQDTTGCRSIFLVDDLGAELDINHRKALCGLLEDLKCQVFVTVVEEGQMAQCWSTDVQLTKFHVEHGTINQE